MNFVLPGYGLAALGYIHLAYLTQLCLFLTVVVISWSGAFFVPDGLQIGLATIAMIYLISSASCFLLNQNGRHFVSPKTIFFILFSLAVFCAGFFFKHRMLGVDLYFVPSDSMSPTLKPGQFILVDTWAYSDEKPMLNDIVLFTQEVAQQVLVKRISNWPSGQLQQDELWYLRGDNVNRSRDSRFFGGVKTSNILGRVRLVLLGIDQQQNIVPGSIFQAVR